MGILKVRLEFSTGHLSYLLSQREFYLKVIEFERKEEARDLPIQKDFLATLAFLSQETDYEYAWLTDFSKTYLLLHHI